MGVAFRAEPLASPGPGEYESGDSGFDGSGRLKLSTSMPAFSIGKGDGKLGRSDDFPGPTAYFK